MQFRTFHGLSLAISKADSNRVCYLLVPDLDMNGLMEYIDKAGKEHDCSMVVLSVADWNDDLTPSHRNLSIRTVRDLDTVEDSYLLRNRVDFRFSVV